MVEVIIKKFERFDEVDFDAFRPEKWISNLYNRERMVLGHKLSALGAALFESLGPALAGLEAGTSEDRPCFRNQNRVDHQLLYLLRPADERRQLGPVIDRRRPMSLMVADPATHHQHLHLGVRVDLAGLQLGLFLHGQAHLDRENVEGLLTRAEGPELLLAALRELGPGWSCASSLGHDQPCAEIDTAALFAQLAAVREPAGWWAVRLLWAREEPTATSEELRTLAAEQLGRLLPLYRLIAWSPQNDQMGLTAQLDRDAAQRSEAEVRSKEEATRQAEERQRRQDEARARSEEAEIDRRIQLARLRRPIYRQEWAEGPKPAAAEQPAGAAPVAAGEVAPPVEAPQAEVRRAEDRPVEERPGDERPREARPGDRAQGPGDRPREHRPGDRPREFRPGDRPRDDRSPGFRPGDRPQGPGDRPREFRPGDRPQGPGDRPRDDRSPGFRPGDRPQGPGDRPRDDRSPGFRPGDRPQGPGDRPRDDRSPGFRPGDRRDDRPRDDRSRDFRPGDRPRDDRSRDFRPGDRPRDDRPRQDERQQERRPQGPQPQIGETVRLERGLMAGKEGQIEAIDSQDGLLTVSIRGLKVRVPQHEVKKVTPSA